ncbi:hypothetical protein [Peterkaempfera sp. SMS 1(5)a]|uniref:hypothetical protein n=1 Tax=Peterkaempfera podocarpi TaxID=3232308 RepID=UPI00366A5F46
MPGLPDCLFQRWLHVREEDEPPRLVFRPDGYPLPPSRGRDGLEFRRDGVFVRYRISPRDGWEPTPGRWTADAAGVVSVRSAEDRQPDRWAVIECSQERLVLEPQP